MHSSSVVQQMNKNTEKDRAQESGCPAMLFFHFYILKKQNFKNICRIGKFSKMGVCRPPNGRQGAVAHPVGDMT